MQTPNFVEMTVSEFKKLMEVMELALAQIGLIVEGARE